MIAVGIPADGVFKREQIFWIFIGIGQTKSRSELTGFSIYNTF